MRGDGCIYSRGNMLWIAYSFRGKMFRESAHTTDEKVARKVLRQRLKQVERPGFVGSKEDRWTLADMKARIKADYERRQNRSLKTVEYCFKHLEAAFQFRRVIDITTPVIQEYTANRLKAGAARASVNRELAYLRRGFKLMRRHFGNSCSGGTSPRRERAKGFFGAGRACHRFTKHTGCRCARLGSVPV